MRGAWGQGILGGRRGGVGVGVGVGVEGVLLRQLQLHRLARSLVEWLSRRSPTPTC